MSSSKIEIVSECVEQAYDEWWKCKRSHCEMANDRASDLERLIRDSVADVMTELPTTAREQSLLERMRQLLSKLTHDDVVAGRVEH